MIYLLAILIGLATGCLFTIQPSINGSLGHSVEHPIQAALISFVIGTATLLVVSLVTGNFPPRFTLPPSQLPFWIWFGGAIGVVVVTSSLIFVPKIGSLVWLATVISGQILMGLAVDHYGWLGNPRITMSPMRVLGALLLLAGMALVIASKGSSGSTDFPEMPVISEADTS